MSQEKTKDLVYMLGTFMVIEYGTHLSEMTSEAARVPGSCVLGGSPGLAPTTIFICCRGSQHVNQQSKGCRAQGGNMAGELDRDIEGLRLCVEGMEMSSERMRKANLEYLYDRFILQPVRDARRKAEERSKPHTSLPTVG